MPGMAWVALRKAPLDHVRNRIPDTFVRADLYPGAQPVDDDPGTLGCLTQRARELWGAPVVARVVGVFADGSLEWAACDLPGRDPMYGYRSEYAALLAACDAAPNPTTSTANPQGDAP